MAVVRATFLMVPCLVNALRCGVAVRGRPLMCAAAAPRISIADEVASKRKRRRGARRRDRGPPLPPRELQRSEDGVPEIARCYPEDYTRLLAEKVGVLESLLSAAIEEAGDEDMATGQGRSSDRVTRLPPAEVFESERTNFRMRASFQLWREDDGYHYVMYNRGDARTPHQVVHYPMGSDTINAVMPPLLEAINTHASLSSRINDVGMITTTRGDALVKVSYNRPIDGDSAWLRDATSLVEQLRGVLGHPRISIVGRSRKVKQVIGGETVVEQLSVPRRGACEYVQTEGAFSQPNARVCEKMLGWAYAQTAGSDDLDLCELYCGNGCFTVALAPNFRSVVATEMSKASVSLARDNLARNGVDNVRVARLSAEEFVQAYEGTRRFDRLRDAGIYLEGSGEAAAAGGGSGDGGEPVVFDRLHTLFVDPPRAGLDETCRKLAAGFERIVYVSCNPETLARDVAELSATHAVKSLAAFDQFPYTPHLEAGVVLERVV